jgi:hypothetical protein
MNYPLAMKALARKLDVPLVDMTALTGKKVETLRPELAKKQIYCAKDNTHLSGLGALTFASVFAQNAIRQGIMKDYISIPSQLKIFPASLDFGDLDINSSPSVKAISIMGIDVAATSDIMIDAFPPMMVSLKPDAAFGQGIEISQGYHGSYNLSDFYLPFYVKFFPTELHTYQKPLSIIIDGKRFEIPLSGRGFLASTNPAEGQVFVNEAGNSSTSPYLIRNRGNVSANFTYKGLYYSNTLAVGSTALNIEQNVWKPETDMDAARYIELTLKALEPVIIDKISFRIKAGAADMQFTTLGSLDRSFFKTDAYAVMQDMSQGMKTYSFKANISLATGQIYRVRIYPWSKNGGENKYIVLDNMSIAGNSE